MVVIRHNVQEPRFPVLFRLSRPNRVDREIRPKIGSLAVPFQNRMLGAREIRRLGSRPKVTALCRVHCGIRSISVKTVGRYPVALGALASCQRASGTGVPLARSLIAELEAVNTLCESDTPRQTSPNRDTNHNRDSNKKPIQNPANSHLGSSFHCLIADSWIRSRVSVSTVYHCGFPLTSSPM